MQTTTIAPVQPITSNPFEARLWREGFTTQPGEGNGEPREIAPVWAIYDVESSVMISTAGATEATAAKLADCWNAGNIPRKYDNKAESARTLRKLLQPGDTVKTILRSVSRSGMMRRISCIIAKDGVIVDITWDVARLMGDPIKQRGGYVQDAGIVRNGCGMDMGFDLVYTFSHILFADGFGVDLTMPDGSNSRAATKAEAAALVAAGGKAYGRNGDGSGWDNDGGYALNQRWL